MDGGAGALEEKTGEPEGRDTETAGDGGTRSRPGTQELGSASPEPPRGREGRDREEAVTGDQGEAPSAARGDGTLHAGWRRKQRRVSDRRRIPSRAFSAEIQKTVSVFFPPLYERGTSRRPVLARGAALAFRERAGAFGRGARSLHRAAGFGPPLFPEGFGTATPRDTGPQFSFPVPLAGASGSRQLRRPS